MIELELGNIVPGVFTAGIAKRFDPSGVSLAGSSANGFRGIYS
jgi:hypothetical protein